MRIFTAARRTRGETMIEVLVALTFLIIGAVGAFRLFSLGVINNQLTKEHVVATNLAREGIEAVRSIRDTNWLRFAGERRKCWNTNPSLGECVGTQMENQSAITPGSYRVEFDSDNYRWLLQDFGTNRSLDLTDGVSNNEGSLQLYRDADTGLISQDQSGEPSLYYREIYIEYLNDTGTALAGSPATAANVMRVTSKVEWSDRGKISDVTLSTILTDYLGRTDHE
jgi:type II secretory pathway pseudopilin PulG